MANVSFIFGSWVSADGVGLVPGSTHSWILWGFAYGDTVAVSAHPVAPAGVEHILEVENVRFQADGSEHRMFFDVRNVGTSSVIGYGLGGTWISA